MRCFNLCRAHVACNANVAMYRTNMACAPAGAFSGPMVVSMRPLKPADAIRAIQITSRFPAVHGAPVHIGKPELIGIHDLSKPDYGDPVEIRDDEIPVFWACGVTPQAVIAAAKPEFRHHALSGFDVDHGSQEFAACRLLSGGRSLVDRVFRSASSQGEQG